MIFLILLLIIRLSMAGYRLLTTVAAIDTLQKAGQNISDRLNLLEYLTQEARETLRSQGRIEENELEKAHRKVFTDIVGTRESADKPDEGGKRDE